MLKGHYVVLEKKFKLRIVLLFLNVSVKINTN